MQKRTRIPTAKARSTLLVGVLLAAVAVLTFLPISAADAQTPAATATAALPDGSELNLKARATERGVELSWEAAAGAVRYELITWWDQNLSWQAIGGDNLTGTTYTHTEGCGGDEVPVQHPRGERGGGSGPLGGEGLSDRHRACADGGGDIDADSNAGVRCVHGHGDADACVRCGYGHANGDVDVRTNTDGYGYCCVDVVRAGVDGGVCGRERG